MDERSPDTFELHPEDGPPRVGLASGDASAAGFHQPASRQPGPFQVECVRRPRLGHRSSRTLTVARQFGLPLYAQPFTVLERVNLPLGPGTLVGVVGPSGSGKSSLLEMLHRARPDAMLVHRAEFQSDAAVVDVVAPDSTLREAVELLNACALGEPRLWLRCYDELSEGEKFRVRLARALGLTSDGRTPVPLLCDEFCSSLHERAARAVAFNLHKLVRRRGLCAVVATGNAALLEDLHPQVVVRLLGGGKCAVEHCRQQRESPFSLLHGLGIERGGKRDYSAFAEMHYRGSEELGFVDKVFVLREKNTAEALGIVVYSFSPLELALRNRATNGRFIRNAADLNRSMRILRRLVIHPDVRGCGLGHHLVRETLPQAGTEYVECLAALGASNPVFEKAGMQRIGQCEAPPRSRRALADLQALDVDPQARDFVQHVCRRRRVRQIVAAVVSDWYGATTGGGERRVERQSPEVLARSFRGLVDARPVYYLWRRSQVE